jgi:hypothetical protein
MKAISVISAAQAAHAASHCQHPHVEWAHAHAVQRFVARVGDRVLDVAVWRGDADARGDLAIGVRVRHPDRRGRRLLVGLVVVGFAEVDRHDGHIARVVVVIVPVYLVVPRRLLR